MRIVFLNYSDLKEHRLLCYSLEEATDFHIKLAERLPQYRGRWHNSLKEQIKYLPEFEKVEREVMRHLKRMKL